MPNGLATVKELPEPIRKLFIQRVREHGQHKWKIETEEKLNEADTSSPLEWAATPEQRVNNSFWSEVYYMRWTDKMIEYARSIVGDDEFEIFPIF